MVSQVIMGNADPEASEAQESHNKEMEDAAKSIDISGVKKNNDGSVSEVVSAPAEVPEEAQDDLAGAAAAAAEESNVPEKFRNEDGSVNVEALLKSQQELEKQFHKSKQGEADERPEETASEDAESGEEVRSESPEGAQGTAVQKAREEYLSKGTLTDETYKALEESAGYNRETVDTYLAGLNAEADRVRNEIWGGIGGQEEYTKMVEWGQDNLTDEEKQEFNKGVFGDSVPLAKATVQNFYNRYKNEADIEPSKVVEGGVPSEKITGFRSQREMVKAMSDPRYKEDAAYRNDVAKRLAKSGPEVFGS